MLINKLINRKNFEFKKNLKEKRIEGKSLDRDGFFYNNSFSRENGVWRRRRRNDPDPPKGKI
jgi:hypothetical protein